jgi:hypothetical protein
MRPSAIDTPGTRRRASSYLEVQAAFAVLGISLAGLAPAVVSQLRMASRVDALLPAGGSLYLAPSEEPWDRKLGLDASLSAIDPGSPAAGTGPTLTHRVEVVLADLAGPPDRASVEVLVEEIP